MPDARGRLASGIGRLRARLGAGETKPSGDGGPEGGVSPSGAPLFFVVGRAKSGTTWLMKLLDAHPEVLCRGEGRFFGREAVREVPEGTVMRQIQPRSLYGAVADSEYLRDWVERSAWRGGEDVDEHLTRLTGLATRYFLERQLVRSGKRIVGDKTPFAGTRVVEEVAAALPEAKVIHVIRDGRDTAVSSVHHVWNRAKHEGGVHDLSPEELAKREAYRADPEGFTRSGESIFTEKRLRGTARSWTEMVGKAVEDGPRLLGSNYAEVRYEDLLSRPHEEAGRLLRFLGAGADEGNVNRCVEAASFERGSEGRERGQEDPKAFLRKGVAGDWRGVFTAEDRRVFDEIAGGLLGRLGYERDPGR